jgi:DNA gyrase subunit A
MVLTPERTGKIVSARVVTAGDEVTCISANGIILRTPTDVISQQGRSTQGVRVMDLRSGDSIASVAVVREGRLSQVNGDEAVEEVETVSEQAGGNEDMAVRDAPTQIAEKL